MKILQYWTAGLKKCSLQSKWPADRHRCIIRPGVTSSEGLWMGEFVWRKSGTSLQLFKLQHKWTLIVPRNSIVKRNTPCKSETAPKMWTYGQSSCLSPLVLSKFHIFQSGSCSETSFLCFARLSRCVKRSWTARRQDHSCFHGNL